MTKDEVKAETTEPAPEPAPEPPLPGGDVDVADLDDSFHKGEKFRTPTIEDTVELLDHASVPEEHVGKRGLVVASEEALLKKSDLDSHEVTVHLRDETNATLVVPLEAVKVVAKNHAVRG